MIRVARFAATSTTAAQVAALSQHLVSPSAPTYALATATLADHGIVRGAFEQNATATAEPAFRRASGGRSVRLSPGVVYFALALPEPGALQADTTPSNLFNRLVRPLLRTLTASGALAHYFGRDWVAVAKRPAATLAFAHQRATKRTLVEAFVGVTASVAIDPGHVAHLGKQPGSVAELAQARLLDVDIAERIAERYAELYQLEYEVAEWSSFAAKELALEPDWQARIESPMGLVGARRDERGALQIGGELMISSDVLAGLTTWLDSAETDEEFDEALAACLGGAEVALFGLGDPAILKQLVRALPRR